MILTALLIAFSIIYKSLPDNQEWTTDFIISVLPGILPLILMAIIECCKIPIATMIVDVKRWLAKIAYSVLLIGLTLITFETLFIGLDEQFSIRVSKVTDIENNIALIDGKLSDNDSNIESEKANLLSSIEQRQRSIDSTSDLYSQLNVDLTRLRQQHNEWQAENDSQRFKREELREESRRRRLEQAQQALESTKKRLRDDIAKLESEIAGKDCEGFWRTDEDCVNEKVQLSDNLSQKRRELNALPATATIDEEPQQTNPAENSPYSVRIRQLERRQNELTQQINSDQEAINEYNSQIRSLHGGGDNATLSLEEKAKLQRERLSLEQERAIAKKGNFVYRLSDTVNAVFTGLSPQQAFYYSKIAWLGSLSFIAAIAGTGLAFGSRLILRQATRDPNKEEERREAFAERKRAYKLEMRQKGSPILRAFLRIWAAKKRMPKIITKPEFITIEKPIPVIIPQTEREAETKKGAKTEKGAKK